MLAGLRKLAIGTGGIGTLVVRTTAPTIGRMPIGPTPITIGPITARALASGSASEPACSANLAGRHRNLSGSASLHPHSEAA